MGGLLAPLQSYPAHKNTIQKLFSVLLFGANKSSLIILMDIRGFNNASVNQVGNISFHHKFYSNKLSSTVEIRLRSRFRWKRQELNYKKKKPTEQFLSANMQKEERGRKELPQQKLKLEEQAQYHELSQVHYPTLLEKASLVSIVSPVGVEQFLLPENHSQQDPRNSFRQ
jgi:hypothetical protein